MTTNQKQETDKSSIKEMLPASFGNNKFDPRTILALYVEIKHLDITSTF